MDNLYVIKQKTWSFRFFRFLVLKRKRFFWFQRSYSCSFLLHLLFSLSNHQEIWKKLSSFCCHFVNLNFMHLFFVLSFSCSLFQLFPRDLVHPFSHRVTRLYRFIFCSFIPLEVYTADVIFWGTQFISYGSFMGLVHALLLIMWLRSSLGLIMWLQLFSDLTYMHQFSTRYFFLYVDNWGWGDSNTGWRCQLSYKALGNFLQYNYKIMDDVMLSSHILSLWLYLYKKISSLWLYVFSQIECKFCYLFSTWYLPCRMIFQLAWLEWFEVEYSIHENFSSVSTLRNYCFEVSSA